LPLNECPVTDIRICTDEECSTDLTDSIGIRIVPAGVDSFALEVNLEESIDPMQTLYFGVWSFDLVEYFPFDIYIYNCSVQVISPTGSIFIELPKNFGVVPLLSL